MLLLLSSLAHAGPPPEYQLCLAAERGDLTAVQRLIQAGVDVNAADTVRLDEPVSDEGMFWRVMASIVTGGLLIPVFMAMDQPEYASYHALSCALGATEVSWPVVEALLTAGADLNLPSPGAPLRAWTAVHAADPDAPARYAWLRTQGAIPDGLARDLLVEDRPLGAPLLPLVEVLLREGVRPEPCAAAALGDLGLLPRLAPEPAGVVCRLDEDPGTLLNVAAAHNRLATATWLLDAGVDPNQVLPSEPTGRRGLFKKKVTWGRPALTDAVLGDHTAMVRLLLERGASPLTRDTRQDTVLDTALWRPANLGLLLDALPRSRALPWALGHLASGSPVAGSALRGWLPSALVALADDPARGPIVTGLSEEFWADARDQRGLPEVLAVLQTPPGARATDLRLEANPCLPQAGVDRDAVRARWGRPLRREHDQEFYLPPPGTRRNLFGRAPRASAALAVLYDDQQVWMVTVVDAAALRAAGCDAPAYAVLDLPAWERAWVYGPTSDEAWRYGLPSTDAWRHAQLSDGGLILRGGGP